MTRSVLEPHLLSVLHGLGTLGPWAVIPIYIVAMMLFVSNPILGLVAGAMFGTRTGFTVFSASSAISAGLTFLAGRYFSRDWLFQKIEASKKARALDDMVTEGGWRMVALLRLTAVVPFSAMNYCLGLSKIPFRDYMLATWLAMLPGCLLYTHLGALAGEVVLEGQRPKKSALEWVFFLVGITVTVGISIYATMRVKKILSRHAPHDDSKPRT